MRLSVLIAILTFTAFVRADGHSDRGPYYAFYHFYAPDPAAVVAAMDQFSASECRQDYPADVALSQEVINGSYKSTHFIISTFQTAADQQKAAETMRSCPAALEFSLAMREAGVEPTSDYLGFAAIDVNDWTQDSAFAKFDLKIAPENQADYVEAQNALMAKLEQDLDMRSYGLGVIGFGRDQFTHWGWIGAGSTSELDTILSDVLTHPAYLEFADSVGDIRVIVNQTQVQILKGYPQD